MKNTLLAILVAAALPLTVAAATYDDLINSAKLGDTRDISGMIQRGASVDTTDKEGNTLLILAARDGHADLVEYLIKQRANVNARNAAGDTALRLAAFRGHLKAAELLIAGGAEVNMSGWTPLVYAAFNGHTDIA